MREVWVEIPGPVKLNTVSPMARHLRDVSSDLCSREDETLRRKNATIMKI